MKEIKNKGMLFTKEQVAEMQFRPLMTEASERILNRCIAKACVLGQEAFIRRFRRETGLKLCSFAPGLFYVKYEN